MNKQYAEFLRVLKEDVESLSRDIQEYADKLVKNPGHTLTWSDGVFSMAAELEISNALIKAMEGGASITDYYKKVLMPRILIKAGSPSRSTSQCANLMEQARLAVMASLADKLKWRFTEEFAANGLDLGN